MSEIVLPSNMKQIVASNRSVTIDINDIVCISKSYQTEDHTSISLKSSYKDIILHLEYDKVLESLYGKQ